MAQETYIAVSGGFDPIHSGHIQMIEDASVFGRVIVLLNSDEWLIRKKGYYVQTFRERKKIMESLRCVDCVIQAKDDDGTVCNSLKMLSKTIHYFANGGDRTPMNTPELDICEKTGIIPLFFNITGPKQSSSDIIKRCSTLLKELNEPILT